MFASRLTRLSYRSCASFVNQVKFVSNGRNFSLSQKISTRVPKQMETDYSDIGDRTGAPAITNQTIIPKSAIVGEVLVAISELNSKFGIRLKSFPIIVAVGPQSWGKSSVIEAICGRDILPKGMGMATMKPHFITTIRSETTKFRVGEKDFTSENDAKEEIDRLNSNDGVPQVTIIVYAPNVNDSQLIDLPGVFAVSGSDPNLKARIKKITIDHLKETNFIPLVVHSANIDAENNPVIELVNKHNRQGGSMGVITKMDAAAKDKSDKLKNLLAGKDPKCSLGYGYCAVVLRNDEDIEAGKTVDDKIIEEKEYFAKHPFYPAGVPELRNMISRIQLEKIIPLVPTLLQDIDKEIANLNTSGTVLNDLVNHKNDQIAKRLKVYIEKLVGSSLERANFESLLQKEFKTYIDEYLNSTIEKIDSYEPVMSPKKVETNLLGYNSKHLANPSNYKTDLFKELFSYGILITPLTNSETVTKALEQESTLGCTLPMFDFVLDDPLGLKRLEWNKGLIRYFDGLLAKDNIQNTVYQKTEKMLLEYVTEGTNDELTRKFAEYIIKEIAVAVFESKIKYSIEAMINLEKRPNVTLLEIARKLTQMYPTFFTFHGYTLEAWRRQSTKLRIDIYGKAWNEAYLRVISDKFAENCYRNVAVNMLDKMVEKLLEITIDMFNRENAIKEKNKVTDKIKKLVEIKQVIARISQ